MRPTKAILISLLALSSPVSAAGKTYVYDADLSFANNAVRAANLPGFIDAPYAATGEGLSGALSLASMAANSNRLSTGTNIAVGLLTYLASPSATKPNMKYSRLIVWTDSQNRLDINTRLGETVEVMLRERHPGVTFSSFPLRGGEYRPYFFAKDKNSPGDTLSYNVSVSDLVSQTAPGIDGDKSSLATGILKLPTHVDSLSFVHDLSARLQSNTYFYLAPRKYAYTDQSRIVIGQIPLVIHKGRIWYFQEPNTEETPLIETSN